MVTEFLSKNLTWKAHLGMSVACALTIYFKGLSWDNPMTWMLLLISAVNGYLAYRTYP